jgi:uncharacterized protein
VRFTDVAAIDFALRSAAMARFQQMVIMKTWIRLGLVVLCTWTAVIGRAAETRAEISPALKGAWLVPDAGWDGRTVLLFHGMASDMDDAGGLLKRLAERLAARGIASLRINFRGEGDAMRTDLESTFETRLEDAAAVLVYVRQQPGVDIRHVGVMGFSLGASTAIETSARHPDWFRTMAVWSSPSGDQFAQITLSETAKKALRDGEATEEIPGWKKLTTKRAFYESFRGIDLDVALAKYPGAFLSVRGSEDFLPQHEVEFMRIAKGRPAEAVVIGGASHIFNVFEPELGLAERALNLTVAWFERTL